MTALDHRRPVGGHRLLVLTYRNNLRPLLNTARCLRGRNRFLEFPVAIETCSFPAARHLVAVPDGNKPPRPPRSAPPAWDWHLCRRQIYAIFPCSSRDKYLMACRSFRAAVAQMWSVSAYTFSCLVVCYRQSRPVVCLSDLTGQDASHTTSCGGNPVSWRVSFYNIQCFKPYKCLWCSSLHTSVRVKYFDHQAVGKSMPLFRLVRVSIYSRSCHQRPCFCQTKKVVGDRKSLVTGMSFCCKICGAAAGSMEG